MFIWDFVAETVLGQIIDWIYGQIVGFLGDFFMQMGNMGADLFEMSWVQSIVLFFSYLAWALYATAAEWKTIIQNQWIDFIRVHLSDIGGVTPAVKLAHFCDAYGVRTAWHGPNDLSPIGMCAQMHLDLNSHNFGIQEFSGEKSVRNRLSFTQRLSLKNIVLFRIDYLCQTMINI